MGYSSLGLIELLKNKSTIVGLEIGNYDGTGADFLLTSLPQLTLYGIDPYQIYTDWNGRLTHHADDPDSAEKKAKIKLAKHEQRFIHYKQTSDDALVNFENDFFDFIFIDGLHTYEQVLLDCKNYYPKLKQGGVFSGHDYNTIQGVRQAVDEFAHTQNKIINLIPTDAWYFIK
jgi:hypothetical protein